MDRFGSGGAGALVAAMALATATGATAQQVHKCTVGGQVTYQAQPCASADVVLSTAPAPSDQETRDARNDLARQRYRAATGRILPPAVRLVAPAPPPPPPAPATTIVTTTTTNTTVLVRTPSATIVRSGVILQSTTTRTSSTRVLAPAAPLSNCDKLRRDYDDAVHRREVLQAPSELATRAELLRKAEADLQHVQQMAQASDCRLAR